jgi:ferredoxin
MKVKVDEDVCIGSMACETTCPEVFKVIGGISEVQMDDIPEELQAACREAADNCPVSAIEIIED